MRLCGFCAAHTWQYERLASPQAICTAHPSVLRGMAKALTASAETGGPEDALAPGPDRCDTSQVALKAQEESLQSLSSAANSSGLGERTSLPNLSLTHLQMLVERVADRRKIMPLLFHAAEVLGQLADRMERFNRKREHVLIEPITGKTGRPRSRR